jgi:outer membrane protein assembly factor BamB
MVAAIAATGQIRFAPQGFLHSANVGRMTFTGRSEIRRARLVTAIALSTGLWHALVASSASAQQPRLPPRPFLVNQFGVAGTPGDSRLSGVIRLDEIDAGAQTRLAAIAAYLADEQWGEAIDALEGVARDYGDKVVQVAEGRYVGMREYFHRRIAVLPAAALELYRRRVDDVAAEWRRQGLAARDPRPLLQLLDQCYCSSWGDDALLALGEMALERGDYMSARAYWESIHPALRSPDGRSMWLATADLDWEAAADQVVEILSTAGRASGELIYPDSDLDVAGLRARLVLASILEGASRRAEMELDVLRRVHPDATGRLGGRTVVYADYLEALREEASFASRSTPLDAPSDQWTMFAGNPQRIGRSAPAGVVGRPAWEKPIELAPASQANFALSQSYGLPGARVTEDYNAPFSYFPLVADGKVYVCHPEAIQAFDLATGAAAYGQPEGAIFEVDRFNPPRRRGILSSLGVARHLMTIHNDRLYARIGDPATTLPPDAPPADEAGGLVCLDLSAGARILWKASPGGAGWSFDGAPLVEGDQVYIAMRRSDVRPQAHIVCLDAASGQERWRRFVCSAETFARGQVGEISSNLLTLAGETLYFNTNMGAIAAVSARDGRVQWITTYPRGGAAGPDEAKGHRNRDLAPCIVARGLVIAAPIDTPEIFALEAATGRLAWTCTVATDAVHLVGVGERNLLASGRRLWWIDLDTGRAVRRWPDSENSGETGFGRPALAGGEVFWPTRGLVRVFDEQTGLQTREPLRLDAMGARPGNLVIAGGRLLIASSDRLYAFLLSDK